MRAGGSPAPLGAHARLSTSVWLGATLLELGFAVQTEVTMTEKQVHGTVATSVDNGP